MNTNGQKKRSHEEIISQNGGETNNVIKGKACPYLDTINRSLLDFDFEHSCSVSLQSGLHVYGCLVCGKFFRGRGKHTPAYTHSLEDGHMVFVHLSRRTFHCLPDDYEIQDPSLNDISEFLKPLYQEEEIRQLDQQIGLARDLFGRRYLPGFVGLNNLNKTDFVNATLQALAHVRPLRDFFLRCSTTAATQQLLNPKNKKSKFIAFSPLAQCFGETIRKMWSDKRFKSTVNPHMLVQAISVASKKRFTIGKQAEIGEFIAWLLHQIHIGVGGSTRKPGSSIIHQTFQGIVEITTRTQKPVTSSSNRDNNSQDGEDDRLGSDDEGDEKKNEKETNNGDAMQFTTEENTTTSHFLQLTLDIPEKPLFKDDDGGLVIPQEPLVSVLKKFDGISFIDVLNQNTKASPKSRRYRLKKLPNYLLLHLTRFKRNEFTNEKNPTIVAFPVKNLDLSQYVFDKDSINTSKEKIPTEAEIRKMSVSTYFITMMVLLSSKLKHLITNHLTNEINRII